MPVRSRSRASSATRKSPQLVVDRAQLVELGVEARRDHAAVAHQRRGLRRDRAREQRRPSRIDREPGRELAHERRVVAGERLRSVRAAARACRAGRRDRAAARGAARCARRCARRRRCRRAPRRSAFRARGIARANAAIASWRALAACLRSRSGCGSQWRSSRLPAAVAQVSSSDSSVGAGSPRSVSVISRLRRVAASSARTSLADSTASARTCASAACCVAAA